MPNLQQPLDSIVDVSVTISALAASAPAFNAGLIVGNSAVIPTTGANARIRQYSSLAAMSQDGFQASDPEYIAAQLYFGQSPAPVILYVGAQDPTSAKTVTVDATAGTGYVVGDILTIVQGGASGATIKVTTIGAEGAITAVQLLTQGTGYSVANGLATTGGTGTGAEIDITAIGETPLQALTACRNANPNWYAAMVCGAADADHEAIAAYVQAASPQCVYFFASSDAKAPAGDNTSVFGTLQTASYNRVVGLYSTTQGGAAPNNAYSAASVMGYAMGANTGLANSQYTLKFKSLPGVTPEPLTGTQIAAIEAQNGNVYIGYASSYTILEQGVVANGQFFDEIIGLDMLAAQMQVNVMNVFTGLPSVPQDDAGELLLKNAVDQACAAAVTRGFIAPSGTWTGQTILNLTSGTPLPKGYLIQSQPFSAQSASDRDARKGMPIYVSLIEANAIHSVTIGVTVQR